VRATGGRVVLDSLLAYEAQVAGMADVTPGSRWLDPVRGWIERRSVPAVAALRHAIAAALRADGHAIGVVNGGGTGSLASTAADPGVTEVTPGSVFYAPHLFDGYHGLCLRTAALFALPVVRRSDRASSRARSAGGSPPARPAAIALPRCTCRPG